MEKNGRTALRERWKQDPEVRNDLEKFARGEDAEVPCRLVDAP